MSNIDVIQQVLKLFLNYPNFFSFTIKTKKKKIFGFSGQTPMKLQKIQTDKLNDKALNQLKTNLFEFKDENLELKLNEEDPIVCEQQRFADESSYNEIHGRWLLVNGNKLKKENIIPIKNSGCKCIKKVIIYSNIKTNESC